MTEKTPWWQRKLLIIMIITIINGLIFTFTDMLGGFEQLDRSLFDFTCKLKTGDWKIPCVYSYPER
ncbi:hypothetical protein [Cyanothece sp. BG0011]|uniref:hypothetical protein n=1 Tax=Cyanothece sp. BG0011 TaxID=2082950 RepID=UPI000D1EA032|nr:hypothetical protein [Cyanothece sp. BG0011]